MGVLDELGVLDAVGRIGTAGVLEAVALSGAMVVGTAGTARRIRKATLACCPALTVTLSSEYPKAGCQARMRYRPGGTPLMAKVPLAAVCA